MYRLLAFLIAIVIFTIPASAEENSYVVNSKDPVSLSSDFLYYDRVKDLVYAKGNVEIEQNSEVLYADNAIFKRTEDIIYLEGNVVIRKADGSLYFSDSAKLRKSSKQGFAVNFSARMGKKTLLASKSAELVDDNTVVLEDLAISPCKICENNYIPYSPLWQFRANKATIDKENERIYYKDAKVDFLGVPIAYTPYLSSPTPGAKRKTGFLLPVFSHSSNSQGFAVGTPFYWNIAKNKDATITPVFSTKGGEILHGQFRHKIKQGDYQIDGSVAHVQDTTKTGAKIGNKKALKGHYQFRGDFEIDNPWNTGNLKVNSRRVFDTTKTYLERYKISSDQILNTDATYSTFFNRDSYIVRGLSFQDLRPSHNNKTTPHVLPGVDIHTEKKLNYVKGMKLHSNFNALNLFRTQGISYQRLSISEELKLPIKMPFGQRFTTSGYVRADGYNIEKKPITVKDTATKLNNNKEGNEGRIFPELRSEWNWPLYKRFSNNILIVEPVVQVMVAPVMTNLDKVGNEDSQAPEISASNLFSPNRYVGFDKVESGTRMNYGMRANMSFEHFRNINFIFGQSIRSHKDMNFDRNSGLDGYKSDYVGKITLQPDKNIFLNNSSRLDEDNFQPLRNEVNLDFVYPKWTLRITHLWIDRSLIPVGTKKYRQEVGLTGSYNFYNEWSVYGGLSSRLGKKISTDSTRITTTTYGIGYLGDCLHANFVVSRDYTKLKDLRPENSYTFNISVPMY